LHKLMLVLCSNLRNPVHYYVCFLRERHQYHYKIHVWMSLQTETYNWAKHSLLHTHTQLKPVTEVLHYYMHTFCITHTHTLNWNLSPKPLTVMYRFSIIYRYDWHL
jgi:hypothetical protein